MFVSVPMDRSSSSLRLVVAISPKVSERRRERMTDGTKREEKGEIERERDGKRENGGIERERDRETERHRGQTITVSVSLF